ASASAAADPRISENPIYAAAVKSVEIGVPLPKIVGFSPWLRESALSELQKVMVGRATVEQAVDAMARDLDRALR
ncbi:MAG: sugar ABC transporter substrate-binding protein, partial [Pseudomonadota bacterium]